MDSNLAWYTARAAGLVSWYLLAASLSWGILLHTKLLGRRARPRWLLDLHRFLGGLAVVFVGVHVVALLFDTWIGFGLTQVLVPFTSSYRPVAVAWGIVGFYLLVAIELTSLLVKRLPKRLWHAIHLGSYALFVVATIHLFTAGTDAANPIVLVSTGAVVVETLAFVGMRRRGRRPSPAAARAGAPTGASPPAVVDLRRPAPVPPGTGATRPQVAVVAGEAPPRWTELLADALGDDWFVTRGWDPAPAVVIVRGDQPRWVAEGRADFPGAALAVVTSSAIDPAAMTTLYEAGADRVVDGQSALVTAGHLRALARRSTPVSASTGHGAPHPATTPSELLTSV